MSKKRKLVSFIALTIGIFMSMLDSTILNIALPDITAYFHANITDTSWISSIYVMGLAVFMIPASKVADLFGRKKVMIFGLILFGGSSFLCGLSHSLMLLIGLSLCMGIGGACITPLVMPMGIEIFGKEKLGTISAAVGAITALAAAGGPPIGGLLIKYVSWQSIYFVNIPFVVICLLLTILFIHESYDNTVFKSMEYPLFERLHEAIILPRVCFHHVYPARQRLHFAHG
jgi:Arabinose efflux permease